MKRNIGILAVVYLQLKRTAKGRKKSKLNIQQFFQNKKKYKTKEKQKNMKQKRKKQKIRKKLNKNSKNI